MFCHKCGSNIVEGSAFCQKCGAKLISVNDAPSSVGSVGNTFAYGSPSPDNSGLGTIPPPRKKKQYIIALFGLLIPILLLVLFVNACDAALTDLNAEAASSEEESVSETESTLPPGTVAIEMPEDAMAEMSCKIIVEQELLRYGVPFNTVEFNGVVDYQIMEQPYLYQYFITSPYDVGGVTHYDPVIIDPVNGDIFGDYYDEIVPFDRWYDDQMMKPTDSASLSATNLPYIGPGLEWVQAPYLSNELYPNSINGTIRNVSGKEISSITIRFLVNGKNGNQLNDAEDSFNGLRDGNTWEFEAFVWDGDGIAGSWEFAEVEVQ